MAIKLKALSTFQGTEGFVKAGTVFEAADEARAKKLVDQLRLAERAESNAEVTHDDRDLSQLTKAELLKTAEKYNVTTVTDKNTKADIQTAIEGSADYQSATYVQPNYTHQSPGGETETSSSTDAAADSADTETASDAGSETE